MHGCFFPSFLCENSIRYSKKSLEIRALNSINFCNLWIIHYINKKTDITYAVYWYLYVIFYCVVMLNI